MITPEQKSRIKTLTAAIVVAEVRKASTPKYATERPQVQADWHNAVDQLDKYLDELVRQ